MVCGMGGRSQCSRGMRTWLGEEGVGLWKSRNCRSHSRGHRGRRGAFSGVQQRRASLDRQTQRLLERGSAVAQSSDPCCSQRRAVSSIFSREEATAGPQFPSRNTALAAPANHGPAPSSPAGMRVELVASPHATGNVSRQRDSSRSHAIGSENGAKPSALRCCSFPLFAAGSKAHLPAAPPALSSLSFTIVSSARQ